MSAVRSLWFFSREMSFEWKLYLSLESVYGPVDVYFCYVYILRNFVLKKSF